MIILKCALSPYKTRPQWSDHMRAIFYNVFARGSTGPERIGMLWHERDLECPRSSLMVTNELMGESYGD